MTRVQRGHELAPCDRLTDVEGIHGQPVLPGAGGSSCTLTTHNPCSVTATIRSFLLWPNRRTLAGRRLRSRPLPARVVSVRALPSAQSPARRAGGTLSRPARNGARRAVPVLAQPRADTRLGARLNVAEAAAGRCPASRRPRKGERAGRTAPIARNLPRTGSLCPSRPQQAPTTTGARTCSPAERI